MSLPGLKAGASIWYKPVRESLPTPPTPPDPPTAVGGSG